jgi:hypothetical protein
MGDGLLLLAPTHPPTHTVMRTHTATYHREGVVDARGELERAEVGVGEAEGDHGHHLLCTVGDSYKIRRKFVQDSCEILWRFVGACVRTYAP